MTVDFNDYFWGEKNNGFDVLYHNMKYGLVASKELSEFLREKCTIEEQNSKLMSKLAHKASTGTLNSTFAPVWTILRTSAEKLSTLHLQMVQKLTELVKDVAKYADELHKKHKNVKEEETQTLESVQAMQASTVAVQKQRDLFASKVQELEKLRKDNGSQKDIEKLETKLRKLQDEFKALLEKHQPIKNDFEKRMTHSCKRFQEIEEMHLRQMKEFLSTYLELLQTNHDMVGQVHSDFKRQFLDMTVDKLLEQFVLNKYTGLEKPEVPELEFISLTAHQQPAQHSSRTSSATRLNQTHATAAGGNASNSNSATSIQGAILRISNDQRGSSGDNALTISDAGSTKSLGIGGANSMGDEFTSENTQSFSRPTSPGFSSVHHETIAPSSSSSNTVSTVKTNFLNWFSSSAPNKAQAQQNTQNYNTSIATSTTEETILDKATPSAQTAMNTSSTANSGNFDYSTSTSKTTAGTKESRDNVSTSLSERCESSNNTPTTYSRRTTSLLNIFSSNSQVSGILRSRRDKAKSKKSKKKKDGEAADNIQEERYASVERENNTLEHADLVNKGKSQTSAGNSTGTGMVSSSALGANDTSSAIAADSNLAKNSTGESGGDNLGNAANTSGGSGKKSEKHATTAASGYGAIEVDEDGYSKQPPKEIAWEQNKDNAGSFYSDSDSDTDNDNDKPERRIHVLIKPLNNGQAPMSASVDELRATVENISLSPTGVFSHSQQLQQSRAISRQQSPEISNASTPTATVHPYAPLQSPTLSMSNNSRYADLGDIFSELNDISTSAPASATTAKSTIRQVPTPTSGGSIAIPRPPSRRSEMIAAAAGLSIAGARGRASPLSMNRADSIGSLEFRTAIGGIGSSRGPSPLTIGLSDTIPLAVAFHEIIHAFFRGAEESRCQVKITGDMMLSFPAGIAGLLANNPNPSKLGFRIKNVQNLEHFIPNLKLVQIEKSQSNALTTMLEFNMSALTALLRRQAEHNPTASYFNVDILKYQVRSKPGASSCPFQLVSYWKCDPTFTALKIDYKYNSHAMANPSPLLNVTLSVPVTGSVRNVQSKPHSAWLGESNRLVWNFTDISQNSQDCGVGTLRARLELNEGPSTPAILSTQFNCEGTTLSGIEFELQGSGYRLSLVKRRFVSGKYVCEGEGIRSSCTPTPPSVGSSSPFSAGTNC